MTSSSDILSDEQLISGLQKDDSVAFEMIYKVYASKLLRFCYQKINNKEECEELVHDIFESLWIRRKELPVITSLQSYLFSMAKYKVIDYIRHSLVRRKFEEHFVLFEAVYDSFPDTNNSLDEINGLIDKSISELPARCQTAFRLRLNDNLPYKDIARRMNISIKTVEKHISSALQHLRASCQKPYYRSL